MANTNFTGMLAAQGSKGSREHHLPQHELEKISCSLASLGESELLALRGKRIRVLQHFAHLPVSRFIAQVMAVQLPAFGSGVETSVLILEDGYSSDHLDYVDVSDLTLLELLPSPACRESVEDGVVAPCAAGTPSAPVDGCAGSVVPS